MRRENGLPAGPIEKWLRGDNILMASLRQGGIYLFRDEGSSWTRLDEDAERGRAAELAEVEPGVVIVGSQREEVLKLELGPGK